MRITAIRARQKENLAIHKPPPTLRNRDMDMDLSELEMKRTSDYRVNNPRELEIKCLMPVVPYITALQVKIWWSIRIDLRPQKQVAQEIGLSESTVSSHLSKVRKVMRKKRLEELKEMVRFIRTLAA